LFSLESESPVRWNFLYTLRLAMTNRVLKLVFTIATKLPDSAATQPQCSGTVSLPLREPSSDET
jgi:hypothetical protein